MEVRRCCLLLKNMLADGAISIIVVAVLIYPLTWTLNLLCASQQEVDVELFVRYILIAFFGKQLGRLFLLLGSRLSKKKKDSF